MQENYLKEELYNLINIDRSVFDFIQSGSLDGIWYWDLEQQENEWMSSKFWQTLGYNPEEKQHLSKEWQDIIFKEDLEMVLITFEKHCADANYPFDQIVRYTHKNGSTVWIRCRGIAIRDKNGKPVRMLGAHTDITELKKAEQEIVRLTEEYEKVFNGTQDSMFLIEVLSCNSFRFIRNNLAHQTKTGLKLEDIQNKSPQELLGQEQGDIVSRNYQKCAESRKSITYEEELLLPGGDRIWKTTLTPILEKDFVTYIVGSATDITEQKKLEQHLQKSAYYDELTGLPNRRYFFERLEEIIHESERYENCFVLLFVDLDGFKHINDNFGHEIGDEVLITAAKRISQNVRKTDIVARMGGDEYTVILKNIKTPESVEAVVKKIHSSLKEEMIFRNIRCNINSSIGGAIYPLNGNNAETLLQNADTAMYDIKKNGKGGFKFYR